ncbi:class IIb bacteriocin, lactobin A/cerein 7B family [Belliella sp. DSM 107340]|uniref:Class IIb bacteriocin, lactobin A/cerein 7B family n=1 Tax=Belliella calami TaxID=2923436 RepID=A0ABS9UQZ2_9BACT|nr:class IIb bacteriocin, lactobin A/cerein 7B family [Belliella calami]MCH7399032.1 class IIb bacteriocin, lactobin A/cerein 7B family [Belliella calami]
MNNLKELSFEEMVEVKGGLAPLVIWGVAIGWNYIGGCLALGATIGATVTATQHAKE